MQACEGSDFNVKVMQKDYILFVPAHDWAKVCAWMVQALLEVPIPKHLMPHPAQGWQFRKPL